MLAIVVPWRTWFALALLEALQAGDALPHARVWRAYIVTAVTIGGAARQLREALAREIALARPPACPAKVCRKIMLDTLGRAHGHKYCDNVEVIVQFGKVQVLLGVRSHFLNHRSHSQSSMLLTHVDDCFTQELSGQRKGHFGSAGHCAFRQSTITSGANARACAPCSTAISARRETAATRVNPA